MPIPAGTNIGPYQILASIGAGGMGEVYRARDTKLGRDVALKVLPDAFARDAERMARFQREAKVLASLNHPNIAAIYGFEDSGNTHALVMELVEGPTLADRIKQEPIPVDEALRIAKQMCDGLEYAHERGIVHRDLKPANVKVSRDDAVKVLDFGLAKAIESDASSIDVASSPTITRMATMQGVLLGTAAYMSPEQAKGKAVDRRADIWAFGCVLYEMLTGKMAFSGETVTDTLAAIVTRDPDWSQLPSSTPARVRALLQRCLQKDAKQRLRDIGDARISLEEILNGSPEPISAAASSEPAFSSRRALPWAVAALLFVVVLALLAFIHFREAPAPAEMLRFQFPLSSTRALSTREFELSPDGRQLAFVAEGTDGSLKLWVRPLNSLEAYELSSSSFSNGTPPFFWSPDSRYMAYDGGGKLQKIDASGDPPQTLCDVEGFVVSGSWSADGVIIFGQSPGVIMRVPASGGTPTPLTVLDPSRGETQHVYPQFLPDGEHFLYHRTSINPDDSGIYVGSIDVPPEKQNRVRLLATDFGARYVPSSDPNTGHLLFMTQDGTLMAQPFDARHIKLLGESTVIAEHIDRFRDGGDFSASNEGKLAYETEGEAAGNTQISWFDRDGKIVGSVGEPGAYLQLALSPDGTRAVTLRNGALWMVNLSHNAITRFNFDSFDSGEPIWSRDGRLIIFDSDRSGAYDLYEKPSDGAGDESLLLKTPENKSSSDVSRDGRFLLYTSSGLKTKYDVWVLPLQGERTPFPFLRTGSNERDGRFSPDGHWVVYVSDESGRYEIYVRPFSADSSAADASGEGAKWQVSYGGGSEPRWSPDGKKLYYLTLDSKVMEVDVTTRPTVQVGASKLLFQALQQPNYSTGDYTSDGKRFLFLASTGQSRQRPLTMVLNWQAALKK